MHSFREYLNEINVKGKTLSKPLWNGKDYLDEVGDINLRNMGLTELPCIFPEVFNGSFYCDKNQLTSLEGAPEKVGGKFMCKNNKLTSLKGAPKEVGIRFGGWFDCGSNTTKFTKEDVKKVCKVNGSIYV